MNNKRAQPLTAFKPLTPDELTALFMRKESIENAELAELLRETPGFEDSINLIHIYEMLEIKARGLYILSMQYSKRTFNSLMKQYKQTKK